MPTKSTLKKPALEVRNDASVYYEKSLTKNLGDYNSAKITVGITLPINPTEEVLASVKSTIEIADNIVTEELKVQNPMEWVRQCNNIRNRVQEIVLSELVYV